MKIGKNLDQLPDSLDLFQGDIERSLILAKKLPPLNQRRKNRHVKT